MEGPGDHDVGHGDNDEGDNVLYDQASQDIDKAVVGMSPGLEILETKYGEQIAVKNDYRPFTTKFEFLFRNLHICFCSFYLFVCFLKSMEPSN